MSKRDYKHTALHTAKGKYKNIVAKYTANNFTSLEKL